MAKKNISFDSLPNEEEPEHVTMIFLVLTFLAFIIGWADKGIKTGLIILGIGVVLSIIVDILSKKQGLLWLVTIAICTILFKGEGILIGIGVGFILEAINAIGKK